MNRRFSNCFSVSCAVFLFSMSVCKSCFFGTPPPPDHSNNMLSDFVFGGGLQSFPEATAEGGLKSSLSNTGTELLPPIVVNQIGQRQLRASNPSLSFICAAAQSQYKLLDILVQHLPHQAIIHAKKEAVKRI